MKLQLRNKKTRRALFMIFWGTVFCFLAYKIHEIHEEQVFVQQHSPAISMPIVGRIKGLGTLRSPNKILVWHKGKSYTLQTGNPYFRKTVKYQRIEVHFDPIRDVAVLKDADVIGPSFLLLTISLFGLGLIVQAIYDFRSISTLQKRGLK